MASTQPQTKEALRKYYLGIRKKLAPEFVAESSRVITDRVRQSGEFRSAGMIHCYVSIPERNEVGTHELIKWCLKEGKQVVVPRMEKRGELSHYRISSFDHLKKNRWGVPEPVEGVPVTPEEIPFVIVPMVSGDRLRNRLGYGKGYYDRFLSRTGAKKTGVLFQCQLSESPLPAEPFDVPLDMLFTENESIG